MIYWDYFFINLFINFLYIAKNNCSSLERSEGRLKLLNNSSRVRSRVTTASSTNQLSNWWLRIKRLIYQSNEVRIIICRPSEVV